MICCCVTFVTTTLIFENSYAADSACILVKNGSDVSDSGSCAIVSAWYFSGNGVEVGPLMGDLQDRGLHFIAGLCL